MAYNFILPGVWELTKNIEYNLFQINVPTPWQQVANSLAQRRGKLQGKGYSYVPVYALDSILGVTFPQIIKTARFGWQRAGAPWIFATEKTDSLTELACFVKDWLREEFAWCLGEEELEPILENLKDDLWHWNEKPTAYSLLNPPENQNDEIRFQAVPDYIAQQFINIDPNVSFGNNNQYDLRFYPVVSLNQGSELMSWPPSEIPLINRNERIGTAKISLTVRFKLQTVPWRKLPLIYHKLSVRRWIVQPLERLPYRGAKAYIGDSRRWLDGADQPFCFMPLTMKKQGQEARWPKPIRELLSLNDSPLVDPNILLSNPDYNWSEFGQQPEGIQAAIAYDSRHLGEHSCFPGVSPLDLASLDRAICDRIKQGLPLRRVGKGVKISGSSQDFWPYQKTKKGEKKKDESTPMLRPSIVAPAVFSQTENPLQTLLIVWETERCKNALIDEICLVLSLQPQGEIETYTTPNGGEGTQQIYQGNLGSICIKTQHVEDLTQNFNISSSTSPRERQTLRQKCLDERISKIKSALPSTETIGGAIIEIRPKPFIREADPKLAWRIGTMQAGYVNQHLHKITAINQKTGEEYLIKDGKQRIKRAVSDLFRQFGILPKPLIKPEIDKIDENLWLTCFYVLRRTRKTTANNTSSTVVLMIRVNPLTGKVELTTPSLFQSKKSDKKSPWVSYPIGLDYLLTEKWDPNSSFEETGFEETQSSTEITREKQAVNKFLTDCLRDCLKTPIQKDLSPRVLLMLEAQNSRRLIPWLKNPNLPSNDLPQELKQQISEPERKRLWVVRLRVANNDEVPVSIVKTPGGRTTGLFDWKNLCNDDKKLYLSIRKPLNTEQGTNTLKQLQSRLDDGKKQAGNPPLLEIAVVYHPEIESDQLADFVHNLRDRWPYFANQVSLPFPFPFATKAKEYAVSAKDLIEFEEELDDLIAE
jgi:hypothetical protein